MPNAAARCPMSANSRSVRLRFNWLRLGFSVTSRLIITSFGRAHASWVWGHPPAPSRIHLPRQRDISLPSPPIYSFSLISSIETLCTHEHSQSHRAVSHRLHSLRCTPCSSIFSASPTKSVTTSNQCKSFCDNDRELRVH